MSNKYKKLALSALLPAMLLAGCSDWLTSPKAANDPNNPITAGRDQLLVTTETGQTVVQTGDLARLLSMWVQSMAGTERQYSLLDNYQFDEDAFSPDWALTYTGGGLVDLRTMQSQALEAGDTLYAGIGKVLEALTMGTAADVWGDIPYSQAVSDTTLQPALDPQQDVYAAIQARLDTAIIYMQCAASTCVGPTSADLFYGGDVAAWTELAHTLKARYYMHVAERDPGAYALALAQTDSGISTPDNDLRSYHSTDPNEWNLWYQFMVIQRAGYTSAGAFMVNLLKSTNDPRLEQYYAPNSQGEIVGVPPGGGTAEASSVSDVRLAQDFRQPMVTFAENQLIRAEAALNGGDAGTAVAAYNAERTAAGVPTAGSVTLEDIITEKYIALFQQLEPWNDYKRTCLPDITPAQPRGVPGRLLYPLSAERNANPNIPAPSSQPVRNWNDPNPCP
ncbi:MAG TPA: SusD/RagB family nutrient-binding outer membrane lipoprotein [Gemmatimonadaceae bacterium]